VIHDAETLLARVLDLAATTGACRAIRVGRSIPRAVVRSKCHAGASGLKFRLNSWRSHSPCRAQKLPDKVRSGAIRHWYQLSTVFQSSRPSAPSPGIRYRSSRR
jgi:hypothetical protein